MMLEDFSSKKARKSAKADWPGGFRPIGQAEKPAGRAGRGFEPSIKQELAAFPHMPRFDVKAEDAFDMAFSADTAAIADTAEPFDEAAEALPEFDSGLPDFEPVQAHDALGGLDDFASPDFGEAPPAEASYPPASTTGAVGDEALQKVLDGIDTAVANAFAPLKAEMKDSILWGFEYALRKNIEEAGKQKIVDFITALVPAANKLAATIRGPHQMIDGLKTQLESLETVPVELKFVTDEDLADIVVTYDTSSMSTRIAEFESLITELG